jgi:Tfp pilus assembly protein PilO
VNQHSTHSITGTGAASAAAGAAPQGTSAAAARAAAGAAGREAAGGKGVLANVRGAWHVYATGVVICAALSVAGWILGIQSAQAEYAAHQADLAELKARQKKAAALGADLAEAHAALERTLREVSQLPLRLEPATAINLRLSKLDKLCEDSRLSIDERRPGPAIDHPHYQTVTIHLVGTGTYPACATFLHELRKRFPDTAVRSFESSNPNPGRNRSQGTFRFELMWYTAPAK